jgi:hypothetical protein
MKMETAGESEEKLLDDWTVHVGAVEGGSHRMIGALVKGSDSEGGSGEH